ncbi:L-serine dehydratase [Sodiomyces alkalinus F11]|uniref:L-serine ammonia-lyase n=1 Tax=Sodiomyces alkalinus (strain CBS 110278 / VKM F-3762 / F11) TaxID=1314773 RepID=A0A3N2Q8Z9_SODAK|nr:L-serine dehydratase [Sodiomyces alkalinus F11]ROT43232.1 L-serine dehydratase [Sodiomyces alkalinus F11]
MGSVDAGAKLPWIETPLIASAQLSRAAECNIFLKLENLQPSGSFKSRGVGNFTLRAAAAAAASPSPDVHFYCSSGGNAGLACATSALALNRSATIVTPTTTSALMISKLKLLNAHVEQFGNNWAEADKHLRENLLAKDPNGVYVPPFDHPHVWDGAATMIDELVSQFPRDLDLHGLVCSVGGGGLLNGLFQGLEAFERDPSGSPPWPRGKPPSVVAVETCGAHSLHASIEAGEHVTLPGITSIATSLGAVRVSDKTWEWAERKAVLGPKREAKRAAAAAAAAAAVSSCAGAAGLESVTVSDAEAALACVRFADDARFLVETACGATIAVCYNGELRRTLGRGLTDAEWREKNVVLVVCGGSGVSLEILEGYREKYGDMVQAGIPAPS